MKEEDWWESLEEDPLDPLRKLAFADWLEEQGRNPLLSKALRWYVSTGRKPDYEEKPPHWTWWRRSTYEPLGCYVPDSWIGVKDRPYVGPETFYYGTGAEAVRTMLTAAVFWLKKGWVPDPEKDFPREKDR